MKMNVNEFKMYVSSPKAARYVENKMIEDLVKYAWDYLSAFWCDPEEAYNDFYWGDEDPEISKEEFLAMSTEEQHKFMHDNDTFWFINEEAFIEYYAGEWISQEYERLDCDGDFDEFFADYDIDEDKVISLWKSDMKKATKDFIPNTKNITKVCNVISGYYVENENFDYNESIELCSRILGNTKEISKDDKVLFGMLCEEVGEMKFEKAA